MKTVGKNVVYLNAINDMHLHVRQGDLLERVLPHSVDRCAYALIMPNINPPVTTPEHVGEYHKQIKRRCGDLRPLMTFKLTSETTPEDVRNLVGAGVIAGKLYPFGATTSSADVVDRNLPKEAYDKLVIAARELEKVEITRDLLLHPSNSLLSTISEFERTQTVLCLHGELPGEDCFDREEKFLPVVEFLVKTFPRLKIVFEHITTAEAVEFIEKSNHRNLAATITLHHLLITRNDVVGDKLNPHNFCKPIAKRVEDRAALVRAALSGNPQFFYGSDSAPHERRAKECHSCCAGIYTAPIMLEFLLEIFEQNDKMNRIEDFISGFASSFYNLRKVTKQVRLERHSWKVPYTFDGVVPFWAGKQLQWRV